MTYILQRDFEHVTNNDILTVSQSIPIIHSLRTFAK